jgi:SAM-dependent methyltransferase
MTISPAEQEAPADSDPRKSHELREVAESFGADAERYDRTRPSYPAAMVDRLLAASSGTDVLDVGCGTGIVARLFQAADCRVLGVEVDPRMAAAARQRGLDVDVAKFEDWDPADRTFDLVVAGQAWHWIDPAAGAAKAAQALRPGGRLAVFWNGFGVPPALGEAFAAVYREVLPESPMFHSPPPGPDAYSVMCARAADGMRQAGVFGEPEEWRFDWDHDYTKAEWLDQIPTFGFNTRLPQDKLTALLAGTAAALDAFGGGFTMRYGTVVSTAART